MKQGTTPSLSLGTPYEPELWNLQRSWATFEQRGENLFSLRFDSEAITITAREAKPGSKVVVTLTQEQTLTMTTADTLKIEIRGIIGENKAVGSYILEIPVCKALKGGVI